jgi:LPS-assembly protein
MQLFPEIQYHRFSESILMQNLYYSADINYKNHYRKDGLNVDEVQIFVPFGLSFSFLNNYLFLDIKDKILASAFNYKEDSKQNKRFKNAQFFQDIKELSLSSELLKPYENKIHTIGLKATLNIPNKIKQKGDIYKISNDDGELSNFGITQNTKNVTLSLNQYLYGKKSINNLFSHNLKQPYVYDKKTDTWKKSDLENDFTFNTLFYDDISLKFTNRTLYNHIDKKIVTSSSTADIKSDYHYAKLAHYLSKKTPNSNYSDNDTRSLELGTRFKRYYTLSAKMNYDYYNSIVSKSYLKLSMSKSCWKYSWRFENDLVSAPTNDHKAQRQHTIYFTIELKSVGAFEYKYITKKVEEDNI